MNLIKAVAKRVMAEEFTGLQKETMNTIAGFEYLEERIEELEKEDIGWVKLTDLSELNLSREKIRKISKDAFIYWMKNPLIKSAIRTQTMYVFGQGVTIQAEHELINKEIQEFWDDPKNQAELTTQQALGEKENELQIFSNIFFVFFIESLTGKVRIRTLPFNEIEDIIYNPEDNKDPWYYKRVWKDKKGKDHVWYYPDWRYQEKGGDDKPTEGEIKTEGVYHIAVNRISGMKFGVSEVYAALDWAKAYKEFLENWAVIVKSYARFTWNMTTQGGVKGVQSIKNKIKSIAYDPLGSPKKTYDAAKNPTQYRTPQVGNVAIGTEGTKLEPIKTAGATTSADDGRRLLLMVSSATGIFEHYLSGDPSTGNLATATAMERPMELMFADRQSLWYDILYGILQYAIDRAALSSRSELKGTEITNAWGEKVVVLADDTENEDPEKQDQPISRQIEIKFPDILEKDVVARVGAVVDAITLKGSAMAGTIPDVKKQTAMLLAALGEDNIDETVAALFPEEGAVGMPEPPVEPEPFAKVAETMESLRKGVEAIVKKYDSN